MAERIFQGMEYIWEVYRAGSFRQAAENLFISQPSLSASVRRVEERLGTPIFDRSVKPLRLTQCGERYLTAAEQVMALENEVVEYVNDWGGLRRGDLTLGGSSLFSSLVLPPLLHRFRQRFPDIRLEVVEETTGKLETMLQAGSVDLVVDYEIPHPECYDWMELAREHLLIAVPRSFPENSALTAYQVAPQSILSGESAIAAAPSVPLERFRDTAFILQKAENDSRRRADRLCAEADFQPRGLLEFDQQMTSYHVSCSGMGACFVGSTLVRRIGPSPDMVYYRPGGEFSRRRICLFWKQGRYITRAMEAFRDLAASGGV